MSAIAGVAYTGFMIYRASEKCLKSVESIDPHDSAVQSWRGMEVPQMRWSRHGCVWIGHRQEGFESNQCVHSSPYGFFSLRSSCLMFAEAIYDTGECVVDIASAADSCGLLPDGVHIPSYLRPAEGVLTKLLWSVARFICICAAFVRV